jgi:FtsZ-binding cell division protein ZapB
MRHTMGDPALLDEILKNPGTALVSLGGIGGGVLWLRNYFKSLGLSDTNRNLEESKLLGADEVVKLLREEVGRLAVMNKSLSQEIRDFQAEMVALRNENADLRTEIHTLNNHIKTLQESQESKCDKCRDKISCESQLSMV